MKNRSSLRIEQDASGRANYLGVPNQTLGGEKIKKEAMFMKYLNN